MLPEIVRVGGGEVEVFRGVAGEAAQPQSGKGDAVDRGARGGSSVAEAFDVDGIGERFPFPRGIRLRLETESSPRFASD